jgi:hypothetical protein
MPTGADDMPALLAWWQDELARSSSMAGQHSGHGTPAAAASTPAKAGPKHAAGPGADTGDAMDVDKTPAVTPKRHLRARTGAQTPAGKTPGQPGSKKAEPLQVPVLLLQDADSVDTEALEELVVALHEVCALQHCALCLCANVKFDWCAAALRVWALSHAGGASRLLPGCSVRHTCHACSQVCSLLKSAACLLSCRRAMQA